MVVSLPPAIKLSNDFHDGIAIVDPNEGDSSMATTNTIAGTDNILKAFFMDAKSNTFFPTLQVGVI